VNLADRLDLSDRVICTIDPDDAKDYDDAISLRQLNNGNWELGVHIADVSAFVEPGSALDEEARQRANSCYFPGHVIPMLPEILSNGVCSLQQDVPRLCKSAFITFDDNAEPIATAFANTVIRSASRLRYREAQAIIDRQPTIPHPDGPRSVSEYNPAVIELLYQMNDLARQIQKRRAAQGQIVLNLPEVELILDDNGRVVGAEPEDQSFTHTLIEMFMVEANEAVARLLDSLDVPFLRRTHPDPDTSDSDRLREFAVVSGHKLPKVMDRAALQALLKSVEGKPESFAINLAVLKSLTRAEYSPQRIGHFALASKHYCHFTSPIRRYADLTIHRLLDAYFQAGGGLTPAGGAGRPARKVVLENVPTYDELVEWGRHLSFNERRADDAERELRKIKLLELLQQRVGEEFQAVVTGIANFGIFAQIRQYLIDGLIRYEDLMDDWWDVDARSGRIRGQRTGRVIRLGDPCIVRVARVDVARRELVLAITELIGRPAKSAAPEPGRGPASHPKSAAPHAANATRPAKKAGRRDRDSSAGPHILAPFGKAGMTHDEGSTRGGPRGGAPRGGGPTGGGRRSGRAQSSNGGSRPNSVKGKNRGGGGRRSGKPKPPRR
jgi:ribonuclease R